MTLTDIAVRQAKPGDKVITLSDSGGLQLRIMPTGGKSWRFSYRYAGKQKSLSLGPYPAVSLANARKARDDAKELLARDIDPAAQRAADQQKAEAVLVNTFQAIADEYLAKLKAENRTEATIDKNRWLLSLALPDLGPMSIASIKPKQILDVLRQVEARGRNQSAGRLRAVIGAVFRLAVASDRAESDPTISLQGALVRHTVKSRAAVTNATEFAKLLRAIWDYDGSPEVVNSLKLMAILVPRPGELRMAEWSEFDLTNALWTVPEGRMKMRRPHVVPLPHQVTEILRAHREVVRSSKLVFPSTRSADRPLSENTHNAALRRLGYSKDEATSHGFRATFSTLANESGLWSIDAIERQLAHLEGNDVRRAYDRGARMEERVRMMNWWADYVEELRFER